uniref:Bromodomain adjacent to zinc finger domain protein 2B n=1 Tax=Strigamia maritima TaxID=126957 RepID=T1JG41_STRMM
MDPGELNSKSPRGNVFDPGNLGHGLFGSSVSNSALLYSHYAHLPNSLPLLSHPSAFPVQLNLASSAFGGLGSLATPATSAAYTSPPGSAWWPMASRLLHPDYLMRSLVSSTTNSTFVNLNRDSLLPSYDVLSLQSANHPPPHKINCEYKSSSRRKAISPVSSSRESNVNSPIYTNPSSVAVTPTFHRNGAIMSPSTVTPSSSESKIRQNMHDRHSASAPGVHTLPVTIITKDSSASWKSSRSRNSPKPPDNEKKSSEIESKTNEKSHKKTDRSSPADLSFSNKFSEKVETLHHSHNIDSLISKRDESGSKETNSGCKNKFTSGSDSLPLESTVGPLNLSLKSQSTVSPSPPVLTQEWLDVPPSRKRKIKPNYGLAKLDMDHTYNQEEMRYSEVQAKHQKASRKSSKQPSFSQNNKLELNQTLATPLLSTFATSTPISSKAISLLSGGSTNLSSSSDFSMAKMIASAQRSSFFNEDNVMGLKNSSSKSDSSSSESDSDSDSPDTEDTERSQSQGTSAASTPVSGLLKGQKRSQEIFGTASPSVKRRRLIIEETELRIPLEHGWHRQTKIRAFNYSGIRGTVTYFSPCGKKFKTFTELIRYLDKNNITDITRENFSFSSKVNIGEFLEPIGSEDKPEYIPLGEQEVIARITELRSTRRRHSVFRTEKKRVHQELFKNDVKNQQRLDAPPGDVTFHRSGSRSRKRMERQKVARANKEAKTLKAIEVKQHKEHLRLLRQQEKFEKQEQIRLEKEMRAQQMLEARKKRQEELEKQRFEEASRKAKERELKRQHAVFLKVQERERRRQHMLLVKALEAHKKQEERERIREERKTEKRLNKERKMELRKLELEALRELRKPVEDLEIVEADALPTLDRIPGIKLPGEAFTDLLMVVEFLNNFGETLGFDMQSLPTLNTLQMALLNNENAEEELISIIHHLLTCAIEDPGPPINTKHLSLLGQALKEVDITGYTISEVLRIFIQAFAGESNVMSQWLIERPYLSLNATQKANILAFICNELLCSRAICRQIDTSIELVASLRKDKWMIEGKLRKLKSIQNKKLRLSQKMEASEGDREKDDKSEQMSTNNSPAKGAKEEEDDGANESGNESEGSQLTGHGEMEQEQEEEEEIGMSLDELKKQIDKLSRQMNQFRGKLVKANQQLRAMSFGQDRYKRRYWVLPFSGGVLAEGVETSELKDELQEEECNAKLDKSDENAELDKSINGHHKDENSEQDSVENEQMNEKEDKTSHVDDDCKVSKSEDFVTNSKSETSLKSNSEKNGVGVDTSRNSTNQTIDSKSLNHSSYDSFCLSMEDILKPLPEKNLGKPWFSLLPRMPCDETSLTRVHMSKNANHAKYPLPFPYNSFGMYPNAPPFSSLPLGMMNGNIPSVMNADNSTKHSPSPLSNYSLTPATNYFSNNVSPAVNDASLDFGVDKLKTYSKPKPIPLEFERGWWRISKASEVKNLMVALHQRGIRERMLFKQLEKYEDFACEACSKGDESVFDFDLDDLDDEIAKRVGGAAEPDDPESWSVEIARRVDLSVLEHVETLEEKLINSSMQVKNWKPLAKASTDSKVKYRAACEDDDMAVSIVDAARARLLDLEIHIEPRYIKPPLGHNASDLNISNLPHTSSSGNTSANSGNNSGDKNCSISEEPSARLIQWRLAVEKVQTSAQLAMCLSLLENCIAWDKSIMKAVITF